MSEPKTDQHRPRGPFPLPDGIEVRYSKRTVTFFDKWGRVVLRTAVDDCSARMRVWSVHTNGTVLAP